MKKLISLMAILPIAGTVLLSLSNNAEAAAFKTGDTISGSGSLFAFGIDAFGDPTGKVFYGGQNPVPLSSAITLGKAGNTRTFANIGGTVDTFVIGSLGPGDGFYIFDGATAKIKSYITAAPGVGTVPDFLTIAPAGSNPGLTVELDRNFYQAIFSGDFFAGLAYAKVQRSDDPTIYNGIFFTSSAGISLSTFGTNAGTPGVVNLVSNTVSDVWSLRVVAVAVPEPSEVAGLLALGVLGGGVVLKRKLNR